MKKQPTRQKETFTHLSGDIRGHFTGKIYLLGQALERDCPHNDCQIFLNTFRLCEDLDEQVELLRGWGRQVLIMELDRQYRSLERMYLENYAVRKYRLDQSNKSYILGTQAPEF